MKPIISPWIVYLAEKCDVIHITFAILGFFCVLFVILWMVMYESGETEVKPRKWLIVLTITSIAMAVLTPEKDTVLTMATLNYITEDKVEIAGEAVEDIVDYVVDAIGRIVNDEKGED